MLKKGYSSLVRKKLSYLQKKAFSLKLKSSVFLKNSIQEKKIQKKKPYPLIKIGKAVVT